MARFDINVTRMNSECENLKKALNDFFKSSNNVCDKAKVSPDIWAEAYDSNAYHKQITKYQEEVNNMKRSMDLYYSNLEYFVKEVGNTFSSQGYSIFDLNLNYDSNKNSDAIFKLENCKKYLKSSVKNFETCLVPGEYEHLEEINVVFNSLYNFSNRINDYLSEVRIVNDKILGITNHCKEQDRTIDFVEVDTTYIGDAWSIVSVLPDSNSVGNTNARV